MQENSSNAIVAMWATWVSSCELVEKSFRAILDSNDMLLPPRNILEQQIRLHEAISGMAKLSLQVADSVLQGIADSDSEPT